jgi:hypothetical protein
LKWNPALGFDCSGIYEGYYVCVGIQLQKPAVVNTTATITIWYPGYTTHIFSNISVAPVVASPTQRGFPTSCLSFVKAQTGDTCSSIVQQIGFIREDDFKRFNPAVGLDCAGLQPGYYYCVMNGALPTPSVAQRSPEQTQSGTISNCAAWYKSDNGDDCDILVLIFLKSFTKHQFISWNPAVGSNCQNGLAVSSYYCVSTPGVRQTSMSPPARTTSVRGGTATLSPIMPGSVANCNGYCFTSS